MTEVAEIRWEFTFEAAHRLPNVPTDTNAHGCTDIPTPLVFTSPDRSMIVPVG